MPWTPAEASAKTKKADTPKLRKRWAAIANSVLKRTGSDSLAISEASGVIKKGHK